MILRLYNNNYLFIIIFFVLIKAFAHIYLLNWNNSFVPKAIIYNMPDIILIILSNICFISLFRLDKGQMGSHA